MQGGGGGIRNKSRSSRYPVFSLFYRKVVKYNQSAAEILFKE